MRVEPLHNYISEKNNTSTTTPAVLTTDAELDTAMLLENSPNQMHRITDASKNVLQFLCFNSPYGGSFFQSLLRLEKRLNDEGTDMVYLFHTDTSHYNWVKDLIKQGKNIYFLTGSFYKDIVTIKEILAKHNIKYAHVHFAGLKYLFIFNIVKKIYNNQLFIVRHLRNHDKPRGFIGESVRKILNHVDLYIGCSESVATEYQKNFNVDQRKITHVTNAIDFNRLNKFDNLERKNYQIDKDTAVFLLFGFDYYRKGVDLVLEAMDKLVSQGYKVCLLLSLSTNRDIIESKIVDRFRKMPDWLRILSPREDIASYYYLSDYFISASREEGFCNSLVESAYCERPIITSDIPGPGSLNIPHTYKFSSENIVELENAMISLISLSEAQKKQIASDQREYVIKNFDLDVWADQISKVYKTLD